MTILEKERVRLVVRRKLRGQPSEEGRQKSGNITQAVLDHPFFKGSRALMCYVATEHEVQTEAIIGKAIKSRCTVTVPCINPETEVLDAVEIRDPSKDLVVGKHGILEPRIDIRKPFDVSRLDLILVPALAFDRKGHRLGRGGGYFDRFLKTLPREAKRVGLGFDFQLLDEIPTEDHDMVVNFVVTNEGVLDATSRN
jgi:5-formyltetrahydrofolate cyclo-ligase